MIGNIFLFTALLASIYTIVLYYLDFKGYQNSKKLARIGYHIMTISVLFASLYLLFIIITHQYQFKYVYSYSDNTLPLGLLISSFFAGQEGSILLWILFAVIIGLFLMEYTSKRADLESRVMMVFVFTIFFLLILINPLFDNPFTYIWASEKFVNLKFVNQDYLNLPFLQKFIFQDDSNSTFFVKVTADLVALLEKDGIRINDFIINGVGMNALLQNFWMQIHPPFLFIGFAMSAVPFSFAISALMKNDYQTWVQDSLPWLLGVALVMGAAIMLGGYWAYGVLGWGGWWGWDPVENSSLVPWIIAVAGIHTMLVQKRSIEKEGTSGRFVKTNLILSILTYVLILYSTFLTRSGVLSDASVHSFIAPGKIIFIILLAFLSFFFLLGLISIAIRWKYLEVNFIYEENIWSRELALFTATVTLLGSAAIIIFGTSLPIFGNTVDISFYNKMTLPLAIIMAFLNAISFVLKWNKTPFKQILQDLKNPTIFSMVFTIAIVLLGSVYDGLYILLILFSLMALYVNSIKAIQIIRKRFSAMGVYFAHIGISIFILGVIGNGGYSKQNQIQLPKGEKVEVFGHNLTFIGFEVFDKEKYRFNVEIEKNGNIKNLSPVMFIVEMDNSMMREPDMEANISYDFYISPISYDDGRNKANAEILELTKGETKQFDNLQIRFDSFKFSEGFMEAMQSGEKMTIIAKIIVAENGKENEFEISQIIEKANRQSIPQQITENHIAQIVGLNAMGQIQLQINKSDSQITVPKQILTVEASLKPFVSLIWIGVTIMSIGFIFSIMYRIKEFNKKSLN